MKLWLFVVIFAVARSDEDKAENSININEAKTFQMKMLARRREEHFSLLKGIALNEKYEWRYQLVQIGVTKVIK